MKEKWKKQQKQTNEDKKEQGKQKLQQKDES